MFDKIFKGAARRALGHGFFALLFMAVIAFCLWIKSFWDEPLGLDGLVLAFAMMWVFHRHLPFVDRIVFGKEDAKEK